MANGSSPPRQLLLADDCVQTSLASVSHQTGLPLRQSEATIRTFRLKKLALLLAAAGTISSCTSTAPEMPLPGFAFSGKNPGYFVSVPDIPQISMQVHPLHDEKPQLRYFGKLGAYAVSVVTPMADPGMGARDCANAIIDRLPLRPGVPEQKHIYKKRLNSRTFAAIYASAVESEVYMHTHLVSAAPDNYCVEVHISKRVEAREEIEPWYKGFKSARIKKI